MSSWAISSSLNYFVSATYIFFLFPVRCLLLVSYGLCSLLQLANGNAKIRFPHCHDSGKILKKTKVLLRSPVTILRSRNGLRRELQSSQPCIECSKEEATKLEGDRHFVVTALLEEFLQAQRPTAAVEKDEKTVNAAWHVSANIDNVKKFNVGTNKATSNTNSLNTMRLDDDTENLAHERVPIELKKAIMQAKMDNKFTQAQLAQIINEKSWSRSVSQGKSFQTSRRWKIQIGLEDKISGLKTKPLSTNQFPQEG